MRTRSVVALSVLVGFAAGAAAVQGLYAQAKPPAYVIAEIDVSNPYASLAAKASTQGAASTWRAEARPWASTASRPSRALP